MLERREVEEHLAHVDDVENDDELYDWPIWSNIWTELDI